MKANNGTLAGVRTQMRSDQRGNSMTIGKPFKKGQSGNPGGRPKAIAEIRELAREHTGEAVATLVSIMTNPKAAPAARVSAANALLDRGYGKPPQHITGEGGPTFVARLPEPCSTAEEWLTTLADRSVQTRMVPHNGPAVTDGATNLTFAAQRASEEHHPHGAWPRLPPHQDRRHRLHRVEGWEGRHVVDRHRPASRKVLGTPRCRSRDIEG
jgi:hypothetical protein